MRNTFLLLSFFIAASLNASGGEGNNPAPSSSNFKTLETQLIDQLHTPFAIPYYKVDMSFRVANDFSIEVEEMEGAPAYLRSHVENLLREGVFYVDKDQVGRKFSIVMHFKQSN